MSVKVSLESCYQAGMESNTPALDPLQQHLADELHVFTQAPILFLASVLLIGAAIYWLLSRVLESRYAGKIDHLEERLRLRDDRIKDYERKLSNPNPDEAAARLSAVEAQVGALQGRRLTERQVVAMVDTLSVHLGAAYITYDGEIDDAKGFASSIAVAFEKAGWTVKLRRGGARDWTRSDIELLVAGTASLTQPQEAARFSFIAADLPSVVVRVENPRIGFDIEIAIGGLIPD